MFQKPVERKRPYSKGDLVKARKLVADIKKAKKDPSFVEAAKQFYKQHTGKSL